MVQKDDKMSKNKLYILIAFIVILVAVAAIWYWQADKKNDIRNSKGIAMVQGQIQVINNAVKETQSQQTSRNSGREFYVSYNVEGKGREANEIQKYIQQTNKARTALDAYKNIRQSNQAINMLILQQMKAHLSKSYILHCSACHSDYANGIIGPSLLTKGKKFIYNRLIAFKTGTKKNVLMKQLVDQLSNKKLKALASEIARFNKKVQAMRIRR